MGSMGMMNLALGHEQRESPEASFHFLSRELEKNGKLASQSPLSSMLNWRA
jgi:hypothetical protein